MLRSCERENISELWKLRKPIRINLRNDGRPAISLEIERPEVKRGGKRLRVIDLTCLSGDGVKALDNVSFDAYAGEILGIAGIAGSGQKNCARRLRDFILLSGDLFCILNHQKTGR